MMCQGTPIESRYFGSTCAGKPGCFWSRLTASSVKSISALACSGAQQIQQVYESLPPDRHTITRSPGSIMR